MNVHFVLLYQRKKKKKGLIIKRKVTYYFNKNVAICSLEMRIKKKVFYNFTILRRYRYFKVEMSACRKVRKIRVLAGIVLAIAEL